MNPKKFANRLKLVLLILAALFSVHFILNNPLFAVTRLEVTGNQRISSDEIIALSGLIPGLNIFRFDAQTCCQAIESHPVIKQADITRNWDRSVAISVVERQTWAVIPYGGSFLCLDDNGIYFDQVDIPPEGDYLIITVPNPPANIELGQAACPGATDMIKQVWSGLSTDQRAQISEFHYLDQANTLYIYTLKGTEVRFGDLERLDEKLKSLAQVFEIEKDMSIQGQEVLEYVDVRFKGEPVVKTRG